MHDIYVETNENRSKKEEKQAWFHPVGTVADNAGTYTIIKQAKQARHSHTPQDSFQKEGQERTSIYIYRKKKQEKTTRDPSATEKIKTKEDHVRTSCSSWRARVAITHMFHSL